MSSNAHALVLKQERQANVASRREPDIDHHAMQLTHLH